MAMDETRTKGGLLCTPGWSRVTHRGLPKSDPNYEPFLSVPAHLRHYCWPKYHEIIARWKARHPGKEPSKGKIASAMGNAAWFAIWIPTWKKMSQMGNRASRLKREAAAVAKAANMPQSMDGSKGDGIYKGDSPKQLGTKHKIIKVI